MLFMIFFATGVATESVETIVTGAAEQAAKVYSAGIETLLNESGQDGSVLDKLGWIGSLRAEDF